MLAEGLKVGIFDHQLLTVLIKIEADLCNGRGIVEEQRVLHDAV
jgi:hypothetical protein